MHPTTSHQIATLQAAELRRRTELRHAHARVRRSAPRAFPTGTRSALAQAWVALTVRSA